MADNLTLPATGSVIAADDISSVFYQRMKLTWGAAGTATAVQVSQPLPTQNTIDSNQMATAGTIVTPKFAPISVSSSGNNTIVAAVTSKKIRVLSYVIVAAGSVDAKFMSSTTTDKSGAMPLVANTGVSANFSPIGHLETASGELLNLNLSAAVGVRGHLAYIEV